MRTRFLIIHNPNAGSETRRLYDATLSHLENCGGTIEVVETTRRGEGHALAAAASENGLFDAVVAAGGDGTVHDVANGTLGTDTPLGIIPLGTANVFARELGLPRSPAALAQALASGATRTIPVGEVNGRPFFLVVGIGFDAEAVRQFESAGTRRLGRAGLVTPVLRAIASHRDKPLRVETDSGVREARWVIVTRTRHYAAGLMLAPNADLADARLHVLCMGGAGAMFRIAQLSALTAGLLRFGPGVTLEAAHRVRIVGDRRVPVQTDGEMLGRLPLDIRIHPKRLKLVFPREHS